MTDAEGTPLSCWEARALVTDAMEGALATETLTRFNDHLDACEACSTFARQIEQTVAVLRRLPRETAPAREEDVLAVLRRLARAGSDPGERE